MNIETFLNLPKKEQEQYIQHQLDYLIAEGMVVKVGKKYRRKTKKEQKQELEKLLQD
jgi:hypothetical protein